MSAVNEYSDAIDTHVADTIAAQISGYGPLRAMLGIDAFVCGKDSLAFTFKARSIKRANHVEVTLMPDDSYAVEFSRVGTTSRSLTRSRRIEMVEFVYAEELRGLIEERLGLRVSL